MWCALELSTVIVDRAQVARADRLFAHGSTSGARMVAVTVDAAPIAAHGMLCRAVRIDGTVGGHALVMRAVQAGFTALGSFEMCGSTIIGSDAARARIRLRARSDDDRERDK